MKKRLFFITFIIGLSFACKKAEPQDNTSLPEGATPYTESDIQFVPYTSNNLVFKRLPALDSTVVLNFKERLRTEEYFAWDQTYLTFDHDPTLEMELRLRYLQSDNSQKTLAIYMPYYDNSATFRTNIFEMPIDYTTIETGFFENLIDFHDTLVFGGVEWYNVYEVNELISTDPDKDGSQNFEKIYFNTVYGIIRMNQKNGNDWLLQQ